EGDIAFLLSSDVFTSEEQKQLLTPKPGYKYGYVPPLATGHPVIVLKRLSPESQYILVTPISAYSWGKENKFDPPWEQLAHRWKAPSDFRSFFPCQRYQGANASDGGIPRAHEYLYLEGNKRMPKRNASWLHIQSVYVVPLTVMGHFTKSRELLRVDKESFNTLREHMAKDCKAWKESLSRL
ncbi:hypothetical protein B0H67DRAFT_464162, partial [Lasiosphaeris hirsuta]